ncbi:hypothetical protein BD289DRAFT_431284 [Coniella lustricola]|uniref:Uncharacterized protein n=1 Tax=Coniella lustricola TaxID=2025994 RepID=A0A2T3AAY3_9PEZI|nr:hypothetical protein BD289DRAFT_431284 [Coniella lustricola]
MVQDVLNKFAHRSFATLMCLKGSNGAKASAKDCHTRVVQICEALDAVFDPATCTWTVDTEVGRERITKAQGNTENHEEDAETSAAQAIFSRPIANAMSSLLPNSTPKHRMASLAPPIPYYASLLHPAMEPLREVYVRTIYLNRFDLFNNVDFLRYLATRPHLSAALLNYCAQCGGFGVVYKQHNGDVTMHDNASSFMEVPRLTTPSINLDHGFGIMIDVTAKNSNREVHPTQYYVYRFQLLNSKCWLKWVVEYEWVMKFFWEQMASSMGKSGSAADHALGYLVEKHKMLAKENEWYVAPF